MGMLHLVTGGAGFLGSHLVRRLVEDNETVIIIDNLSTGYIRNLEYALSAGVTFVYADVAVPYPTLAGLLEKALRGRRLDRIYHLASPASPKAYGSAPWETLEVNALGTMSLIELALEHRARFLFASTSEIYGDPLVHPQTEAYFGNVNPIGPRSCYDEAKRYGEAICMAYARARGVDVRLVRIFNTYGPRMRLDDGRVVPAFVGQLLRQEDFSIFGEGKQTRSFCFVDDEIRGILALLDSAE